MNRNQKKKQANKKANKPARIASVPAMMGSSRPNHAARIQQGSGDITVSNEEFLTLCNGATTFATTVFPLNPGLSTTFPWLSAIAANYEFYQFQQLEVHYRPYVGTSDSGVVALACDHDVMDAAPNSLQTLMTYKGAIDGPTHQPMKLTLNANDLSKFGTQKFVRSGAYPANSDPKTYDVGNFIVGQLTSVTGMKGSIYLKYRVKLMVPHAITFRPAEFSARLSTVTSTKANPFQGATITNANPAMPIATYQNSTTLWLKAGQYAIDFIGTGTGLGASPATGLYSPVAGMVATDVLNLVNGTATTFSDQVNVTMPTDGELQFVSPAAWTTLTTLGMRIAPYLAILG